MPTQQQIIKLLPMDQPYPSLIALGAEWGIEFKHNETRIRSNAPGKTYRGWVAIHANDKKVNQVALKRVCDHIPIGNRQYVPKLLDHFDKGYPIGKIVAIARIKSAQRITEALIEKQSPLELAVGNWVPGGWIFEIADVRSLLSSPIPYKGQQGAPTINDPHVLTLLKAQIEGVVA